MPCWIQWSLQLSQPWISNSVDPSAYGAASHVSHWWHTGRRFQHNPANCVANIGSRDWLASLTRSPMLRSTWKGMSFAQWKKLTGPVCAFCCWFWAMILFSQFQLIENVFRAQYLIRQASVSFICTNLLWIEKTWSRIWGTLQIWTVEYKWNWFLCRGNKKSASAYISRMIKCFPNLNFANYTDESVYWGAESHSRYSQRKQVFTERIERHQRASYMFAFQNSLCVLVVELWLVYDHGTCKNQSLLLLDEIH